MQAVLKDSALPDLMALVASQKDDAATVAPETGASLGTGKDANAGLPDRPGLAKQWLAQHSGSEALNKFNWETYPDKILLLAARYEACGGSEGWRSSDMETEFSAAKEAPPSNFPRDIANAIKSGLIATVTPRTYKVSRTGWNKVSDKVVELDKI